MTLESTLTVISVISTGAAATLALRAATITVRDNLDAFIGDLQRQSRWNAWAALANSIAAAVLIYQSHALW